MGLFDDITCKYPLPIEGANALEYQSKDTPAQYMNRYEIREDGTLWHEDHDIEDHSKTAVWKREHPGEEPPEGMFDALDGFCGCMTHVNKRWVPVPMTGEIVFYTSLGKNGWLEFSAYFVAGKINQLHVIEHRADSPAGRAAAEGSADETGESKSGAGSASVESSDRAGGASK